MKSEWQDIRISEVTINHDNKRIPLSSRQRAGRQGVYPYYGAQGIIDYIDEYIFDGEYLLVAEDGQNLRSYRLPIAQIVNGKFWVNNHAHILTANNKANLHYLCYLLNHTDLSGFITGSAQPKLSQGNLNAITLKFPSLELQDSIVSILSCLDEKIKCNHRINDYLEQTAQALYGLFCGIGSDSAAANKLGVLSDICDYRIDKIEVSALNNETYISTENMLSNKNGYYTATSLPNIMHTTRFDKGNVLISNIRPYFMKILYCYFTGGCSADVLCFQHKQKYSSEFVYCTLYSDNFFKHMVAGSKGTKMPRGDKKQIMDYPVIIPPVERLSQFTDTVRPFLSQKNKLIAENQCLIELRDTLLPRLMSGELSVADL